jgi:medium-chain acyl-[acyl-carrier-protein] hydrolase
LTPAGKRVRLFCFPYAGAFASIYLGWSRRLAGCASVIPVNLPGRGARLREPAERNMYKLAAQAVDELRPALQGPFALFGHSMGAVLAFEIARTLRAASLPLPAFLFVSGAKAPPDWTEREITHTLPEADFIVHVRELNGTPPEIFEHPELLDIILPVLRADFATCETYRYRPSPPLECPIVALGGSNDDRVPPGALNAWGHQTASSFRAHVVTGGHFFVHQAEDAVLDIVSSALCGGDSGRIRPSEFQ